MAADVPRLKPWYGRAIARYLVAEYKLNLYPYEDLIIYEIGAGNGTLMGDILDYIAEEEPEVYDRTRYRIVEISERLQGLQRGRAKGGDGKASMKGPAKRKGHSSKVEVLGGSIFDWERVVPEPCFFLALEVLVSLRASSAGVVILIAPCDPRTTFRTTSFGTPLSTTNLFNASSPWIRLATSRNSMSPSPTP